MDITFSQVRKQKLTLKKSCSSCGCVLDKKSGCHTCKVCKTEICDNCKKCKMILPGYMNPKTVCAQCWRKALPPFDSDLSVEVEHIDDMGARQLIKEFTVLSTSAAEFLAQGGYYYSWEVIRQHIMNGYMTYNSIRNGAKISGKQNICDICWYLWSRSLGKGAPFKSGTIFIEDSNYAIFKSFSLFGYSRVLLRSTNVAGQKVPSSMRIGSSHLSEFIDFCEQSAQWLLPECDTEIEMSKGRKGHGYEQVGIDLDPGVDNVDFALPFNRHHLLIGKVPLKQPDQCAYSFLKFENYGTEAFTDILMHGIQYGLHVVRRDREEKLPARRETPGGKVAGRFAELVQCIFEFPATKPIIKHETLEEVLSRASVKGISYMTHIAKMTMIKLNSFFNEKSSSAAATVLYQHCYEFLEMLLKDPRMDHLDVRFGREVIFDAMELRSVVMVVEPKEVTVEEFLPVEARLLKPGMTRKREMPVRVWKGAKEERM